ncbi:MAG: ABC transporter ATP-binding protein [Deltaproteobacteria bacterium]|nr:MAG: ABC transporter ATP-binding protein [Deltaproteobacteria bacterium]
MPEPLVDVRDVSKVYRQGRVDVPALRDVSLQFEPGDFAVLAGPSGSGKTTLLNLIGALDTPTAGVVRVGGTDLSNLSGRRRAELRLRDIGFVFQSYNLIPVLTAYENAEFVLLLQGVAADARRRRVHEVLADVGLAELADRRPAEMSGGQQQRVAVARAIAGRPKLVLADEPTANLDSKTGGGLVDMMRRLNEQHGVTFIFSSHDPKVIDRAARLIRLEDGRVVADERRDRDAA